MRNTIRPAAIAAMGLGALASHALATPLPFSTSFESAQGYANNSQLSANANWTGNGQDATGWQVTNSTVGGSGPKTGTQWVLASGATGSVTKFQWTVTPVTNFATYNTISGSADVKLASPASGSVNRSTLAGIQMYDASVAQIAQLLLIIDSQNLAGLGANRMLLELDFGDTTGFLYDLGVSNALNQYVNLALDWNAQTDTVTGYFNGSALPDTGSSGGLTDFHDFDMILGGASTTTGGTRARGGFDNYSIAQTPTPGTLALLGLGGLAGARRRRA